ncbi:hypothetical protein GCM10009609_36770 [Pseudonocardia aurantiaca]
MLFVRCVDTAYESLRLTPGMDTSGPTLVWFAGHLLQAYAARPARCGRPGRRASDCRRGH